MTSCETSYAQVVGQVIRGHRELRGISLADMALRLNLATPSGWSRVETGDTPLTIGRIRKVGKVLGLDVASLVSQADALVARLEASGIAVLDDKRAGCIGGAGLLALVAATEGP